jgi:hypothetical protein
LRMMFFSDGNSRGAVFKEKGNGILQPQFGHG